MSPIILDLDRDGVETTGVRDGAHFDHEGDGFAEQTGWVGKDDGLLVWDRDGDGFINDGSELFGSRTKLTNGSLAANGFAALSELDSNRDGKVDAADSSFTSLRVWKDVDGNGISAPDELLDLSAVGVQSITTSYLNSSNLDQNGNDHRQLGSYTRADGTTANAEDVWFKVDRTYSIATETVAVPDDVSVLPYLSGYGLVRDLHQAMASDASGELKSLVSQFSSATSIQQREALLESILFKWSGADAYSPDSRGPFIGDARKLYAVEAFIGEPFIQLAHDSPNPYQDASRNILAAYQNIFESYYTSLTAQTELKPVLELISYHWDAENASFVGDLSEVAVYLNNLISQDRISGKEELSETARVLRGLGFLDKLNTSEFRQSFEGVGSDVTTIIDSLWSGLVATGGNDKLNGTSKNDILEGLGGNDWLEGFDGDDVLNGGIGNDAIYGGTGNDIYLFERGFGQDNVYEFDWTLGNTDVIRFLGDISPSEVVITRDANSLYLNIDGTQDRIAIWDWFGNAADRRIERVEFTDGTIWNPADLESRITARPATEFADVFYGGVASDSISGLGGNDIIYANSGDDVISGDGGNDNLEGGAGNDTYLFGRGHGQDTVFDNDSTAGNTDTIRYVDDIAPSEVSVKRDERNLYLEIQGTSDRITLRDWFVTTNGQIERVEFFNGTVWTLDDLNAKASTPTEGADYLVGTSTVDTISGGGGDDQIYGDAGDDVLFGGDGNDRIEGGTGNDTLSGGGGNDSLYGGSGSDIYLFGRGGGQDTIYETDGTEDKVCFDADVLPGDVRVTRDAWNNLTFSIQGTSDKLVVSGWFSGSASRIEKVEFSDGTVWDSAALVNLSATPTDQYDYIFGTDGADVSNGLQGNDEIYGGAGADVLAGGVGNDVLSGGAGNDVYIFQRGDGQDKVYDYDWQAGNIDTIRFGPDNLPDDIKVISQGRDLTLAISGTSDRITIQNWYDSAATRIEQITFANGTTWIADDVQARAVVAGTDGADDLYGTAGNDVIDGGAGNDVLYGYSGYSGLGDDAYIFSVGSGSDTVIDYDTTAGNLDTIKVIGKLPSEVTLSRSISGSSVTNDLVITINGTTDKLTVANYFAASGYKVERVEFDNGTVWDTTVLDAAQILPTAAGALYGTAGNDVIDLRNAAATTVYGPGAGNNTGNDTYLFCAGAGQDVINDYDTTAGNLDTIKVIGKLPSEVTLSRSISGSSVTNDLVITINGTTDKLTVANYFAASGYKVERVEFDNGTVWDTTVLDAAQILPTAAGALYGTAGNDVIDLRNAAATTVYGPGAGNNTGNDTYLFCAGAGQDVINDYDTTAGNLDTIKVIGKLPSEVTLSRSISGSSVTNDLVITINGTTDKLTVANYFAASGYKVERVEFDNGTVWDTTVLDAAQILPTAAGALYGTAGNDVIDLRNAAATTVYGPGAGNNTGNDTYLFCAGAGQDVINDYDTTAGNLDTIKVIGKLPSEVTLSRSISGSSVTNDLVITINGTTDKLTVANYFAASGYKVERVEFDNGTVWDTTVLDAAGAVLVGTVGADSLSGSVGNDTLDGGTGVDVLVGGSGNDTYLVDLTATNALQDTVTEAAGGGVDTLILRGGTVLATVATVTLGADVDNLDASHTVQALLNLTGNSLDNTLNGNAAANTLNGGVGNDTLDGGAGVDTLVGGAGNDAYVVDLTATNGLQDTVTEVAGGGVDTLVLRGGTVLSTVATVTLGAEVDNLDAVGTGSVLLNLTGNALNNVLTGNAAANVLNGGAGADTLVGGAGNDTYVLDNAGDSVIENVEEGIDLIQVGLATAGGQLRSGSQP
ncbi:MAG: hypothetical protein IPM73_09120 [Betaproteobacteria bacterium]|nr:hypothetical protein [Betaproteobacteria bacterium]